MKNYFTSKSRRHLKMYQGNQRIMNVNMNGVWKDGK